MHNILQSAFEIYPAPCALRRAQFDSALLHLTRGLAPYENAKKYREECKHSSLILLAFSHGL